MRWSRLALGLAALAVLSTTTAEAQGRATVTVSARVEDVTASRESLQALTELSHQAATQAKGREGPRGRRLTTYGAVVLRASTCDGDLCTGAALVSTITYW